MNAARLLVLALLVAWAPLTTADPKPRVAIIIDDLGYHLDAGLRAIALPGPVSFAVLPATPNSSELARAAHQHGKEVLLHLPFEALDRENVNEPAAITLDMSRTEFRHTFAAALQSVPNAIGVSNHRGSLLTQHPGHMTWLMQEIAARDGMFFVDSYTTHASVALQIAAEQGVAATRRHVFLDNDRSPQAMSREFKRLLAAAEQQGIAVGIGHPYPETLTFLERALAGLEVADVELIPVSEAVNPIEPDPGSTL